MSRDTVYLISPGFEDPKQPGQIFICPYCNQVEGLLASFPDLAAGIDVVRVPFARPRQAVIERLGEANQSLPVLVLGDGPAPDDAERYGDAAFINDTKRILDLLAERHGFPRLHE